MSKLECKKPKLCEPTPEPEPVPCSPAFDLCVGDRTFKWDGFCPTVERSRHTPDGTYTSVTVVDGCIVAYGYADEATYTPPYCNPNPTSCQEVGTGTATIATVSPNVGNILTQTSNGLYAHAYIQGDGGITISGTGTVTNPYKISSATAAGGTGPVAVVGRNGVVSETSANGVTYVGLEQTGAKRGVYDVTDRFTVDEFGRIISVEPRSDDIVSAGTGLQATPAGDTVTIGHPTVMIDETMVLGAYIVNLNNSGHITHTERGINITGGVYNLGAYNVGVNAYGSVTSIEQRDDVMPGAGTFTTVDGKRLSYDLTGRLVGVESIITDGTVNPSSVPLPLRDMYKINWFDTGGLTISYSIDAYGSPISPNIGMNRTMTMPLPSYVIDQTQVQVNGAGSWRVIPLERLLEIRWAEHTTSFTVAFRG